MLTSPNLKRILTISPHADDMEIGCGATVAKLVEHGKDVFGVTLSITDPSIAHLYTEQDFYNEAYAAHDTLGIPRKNLIITDFRRRHYPEHRQELLDYLIQINNFIKPDAVLIPSYDDMHQDHIVIAQESFRAFKDCTIVSCELPWNRIRTVINYYSLVQKHHVEKKIKALHCYRSQNVQHRARPFSEEYVHSLAITRGGAIKQQYAEAFEIVRLIG